jgi:hypothetical protein
MAGGLTVERWVLSASPEVSPSGMCQCVTVVYLGDRTLLTLGEPDAFQAMTVEAPSGTDITGDGRPEIVVSTWSGGAHCCYTTTIYSVEREARRILELQSGNCGPGELTDLDHDRTLEVVVCDDSWAYEYCSFADSPMPRVVFAYDAARREYRPATPRFADRYRDEIATEAAEARRRMATEGGRDAGLDKCIALQPALRLIYTGQVDEGRRLIRDLYRRPDIDQFEKETLERAQTSALWIAR